jgi:ribosomal protein S18 acetylase RimI-like enzyme
MSIETSPDLKLRTPEPMTRDHQVASFSSAHDSLDNYLTRKALKANAAGDAKVIVLATSDLEVIGYYAISSASVSRKVALSKLRRNSPVPIPMALIGRFAIDKRYRGQGLGKALMKDAILRIASASTEIGIKGILLHALDDNAKQFYRKCGFRESSIEENLMMVTLRQIAVELDKGPT